MAITSGTTLGASVHNLATGKFIDTGTVKKSAFALGFVPRYVCLINATDRIKYEWFAGMAADSCVKTIADGTATLETSGGLTVSEQTLDVAGDWTVYGPALGVDTDNSHLNVAAEKIEGFSAPAAILTTNKQFYFKAEA